MSTRKWGVQVVVSRVSYRQECRAAEEGEAGHAADGSGPECTGECTWMDGDHKELGPAEVHEYLPDEWDLAAHGTREAWAVAFLRKHHPELTERSGSGPAVAGTWVHGSTEDPYRGDREVTEVAAWLTGSWPTAVRERVFSAVTA